MTVPRRDGGCSITAYREVCALANREKSGVVSASQHLHERRDEPHPARLVAGAEARAVMSRCCSASACPATIGCPPMCTQHG
jgi:hypothetical protein